MVTLHIILNSLPTTHSPLVDKINADIFTIPIDHSKNRPINSINNSINNSIYYGCMS